jgi:hypothetical protein
MGVRCHVLFVDRFSCALRKTSVTYGAAAVCACSAAGFRAILLGLVANSLRSCAFDTGIVVCPSASFVCFRTANAIRCCAFGIDIVVCPSTSFVCFRMANAIRSCAFGTGVVFCPSASFVRFPNLILQLVREIFE